MLGHFGKRAVSVAKGYQAEHLVVLEDVRIGLNPSYDRLVSGFRRNAMPGYRIEYINKPPTTAAPAKRQVASGPVLPYGPHEHTMIAVDLL